MCTDNIKQIAVNIWYFRHHQIIWGIEISSKTKERCSGPHRLLSVSSLWTFLSLEAATGFACPNPHAGKRIWMWNLQQKILYEGLLVWVIGHSLRSWYSCSSMIFKSTLQHTKISSPSVVWFVTKHSPERHCWEGMRRYMRMYLDMSVHSAKGLSLPRIILINTWNGTERRSRLCARYVTRALSLNRWAI